MRFKRIAASKFRPKHSATTRNDNLPMYHPMPLKAAKQHIDTEALPDSVARYGERLAAATQFPTRLVHHTHAAASNLAENAVVGNCLPHGLCGGSHWAMLGAGRGGGQLLTKLLDHRFHGVCFLGSFESKPAAAMMARPNSSAEMENAFSSISVLVSATKRYPLPTTVCK